jgi:predicted GNAT superfamily acetyltransferase
MNTSPELHSDLTSTIDGITYRQLQTWDEFLAAEELQRVVWQMPDWRDAVPANLLITVHKNGGCLLGAFDGARLVGLAFSFIGLDSHFTPPVLKHCSHMLAVLPDYQSRKIGVKLKLAQREYARAQDIALMTWTYDPLLARNANLNISRLGAVARRYVSSAYGEMTDGLNAGLDSDRFEAEWWLDTPRVTSRIQGPVPRTEWDALIAAGARHVLAVSHATPSLPRIESELPLEGETLLVEIPADLSAVKSISFDLAREWRARTRDLFQRAFRAGYVATDFVFDRSQGNPRPAYVLTRPELPSSV